MLTGSQGLQVDRVIKAILTDIEGTTSSIHFVKQVLFPYAARVVPDFIRAHAHSESVRELLGDIARETGGREDDLEGVIQSLLQWISEDRKITVLKTIQGLIWEEGYRKGDYRAHLYRDAFAALSRWQQQGYRLYVYSSGSVHAQKLFFKFSECGDVTGLFNGYFDTVTGPKKAAESYRCIAATIGLPTAEILFLSDICAELDAAKSAGMCTCWLIRPEDTTATESELKKTTHLQVVSFAAIHPESMSCQAVV